MQLLLLKILSTLVAIVAAFAEPQLSAPYVAPSPARPTPAQSNSDMPVTKSDLSTKGSGNLSVAPVPHLTPHDSDKLKWSKTFHRDTYFYPYRSELVAFIGGVAGNEATSNSTQNAAAGVVGVAYVFPSNSDLANRDVNSAWEGGGEYSTANREHFWFARRHIFHPTDACRPYYSYGVMHDLVPNEQLASFSDWDNYAVRVAAGFQDVTSPPRSIQFELVAAAGIKDVLVLASIGMAWGM